MLIAAIILGALINVPSIINEVSSLRQSPTANWFDTSPLSAKPSSTSSTLPLSTSQQQVIGANDRISDSSNNQTGDANNIASKSLPSTCEPLFESYVKYALQHCHSE